MNTGKHIAHYAIVFLMALLPATVTAQVSIGNHVAPFDSITSTWLATVTEQMFGRDSVLTVAIGRQYSQMVIGEDTLTADSAGKHLFRQISADSAYTAVITDTAGHVVTGRIEFTFLPVVVLHGNFGYDYQEGSVTIACPEHDEDCIYNASIKWRGGTTNRADKHKRNYKVKFDHDVELFGFRSDNKWMLDAGQPDVFRMRNRIAMDLWNDMARKPYYANLKPKARNGVSGTMVEVFLNDEYRGMYNFSELIDRKQMKLKKMDDETGEIHGCLYKGVSWQKTQMFDLLDGYDNTSDTLYGFEAKYPDLDDSDTTAWQPLVETVNYIRQCSDEEFAQYVADYFDLPVLVDYSLLLSITNAVDNSGKNTYWAVYDKAVTKRLTPAPWDLDATFGQRWGTQLTGGSDDLSSPDYKTDVDVFVFFRLYRDNVRCFNDSLNARYQALHQPGGVLSTDSIIGRFTHYYQLVKRSGAARRETARWSGDSDVWGETIDFDAEYEYICQWIRSHMDVVDQTSLPLYYNQAFFGGNEQHIGAPTSTPAGMGQDKTYNLNGQQLSSTAGLKPGIYIRQGRKIVVR